MATAGQPATIALPAVRAALDLPVVGTVPAIKPAAAMSETRAIGVLGTRATVRQAYVDDLAARFAGDSGTGGERRAHQTKSSRSRCARNPASIAQIAQ